MPERMGWSKYYVEKYTLNFPCLSNCPTGMTPVTHNLFYTDKKSGASNKKQGKFNCCTSIGQMGLLLQLMRVQLNSLNDGSRKWETL